jgi:hypothetical protein
VPVLLDQRWRCSDEDTLEDENMKNEDIYLGFKQLDGGNLIEQLPLKRESISNQTEVIEELTACWNRSNKLLDLVVKAEVLGIPIKQEWMKEDYVNMDIVVYVCGSDTSLPEVTLKHRKTVAVRASEQLTIKTNTPLDELSFREMQLNMFKGLPIKECLQFISLDIRSRIDIAKIHSKWLETETFPDVPKTGCVGPGEDCNNPYCPGGPCPEP